MKFSRYQGKGGRSNAIYWDSFSDEPIDRGRVGPNWTRCGSRKIHPQTTRPTPADSMPRRTVERNQPRQRQARPPKSPEHEKWKQGHRRCAQRPWTGEGEARNWPGDWPGPCPGAVRHMNVRARPYPDACRQKRPAVQALAYPIRTGPSERNVVVKISCGAGRCRSRFRHRRSRIG
jgi:hypothetical protein